MSTPDAIFHKYFLFVVDLADSKLAEKKGMVSVPSCNRVYECMCVRERRGRQIEERK